MGKLIRSVTSGFANEAMLKEVSSIVTADFP